MQQVPSRGTRTGAKLSNIRRCEIDSLEYKASSHYFIYRAYIHGPSHAILAANSEPKSCPRVAPAPIKPNNLEPD